MQGQILRDMTPEDINELAHIKANERQEFETCQRHVRQLHLSMQLIDIEHLFGGERIVIYYLAEQRVDFRELVKRLASEFQTRIEMRQIGVRDEAKLLADYGDCGQPVCCGSHLTEMPPVSMKMAKLQKATLDPTKISGRCGRLKCCLRYEYDTYVYLQRQLPPVGADVVTRGRPGARAGPRDPGPAAPGADGGQSSHADRRSRRPVGAPERGRLAESPGRSPARGRWPPRMTPYLA